MCVIKRPEGGNFQSMSDLSKPSWNTRRLLQQSCAGRSAWWARHPALKGEGSNLTGTNTRYKATSRGEPGRRVREGKVIKSHVTLMMLARTNKTDDGDQEELVRERTGLGGC